MKPRDPSENGTNGGAGPLNIEAPWALTSK